MQLNMKESKDNLSIRRIGLCWEATRAPRGTRKPQAWAISVAQAGLLRVRYQSEKSIVKLTSKINRKVSYASTPKETFTLNQYRIVRVEPGFAGERHRFQQKLVEIVAERLHRSVHQTDNHASGIGRRF